ncbi:MAG: chloride channel protein [Prochlorococcus sp.]
MKADPRRLNALIPGVINRKKSELLHLLQHLIGLLAVGLLIGLACWPLNVVDRFQSYLFQYFPTKAGGAWNSLTILLALMPIVAMPILLILQRGPWQEGAGSGIPQTMNGLEDSTQLSSALASPPTIQRGILWSIATACMFPLGREGPVVQVGAAVARAFHRHWGKWLPSLNERQMVAIGGGAGLAGGFNTPLLGPIFMIEELTAEYSFNVLWPALVIGISAAWLSSLGGEEIFQIGVINVMASESEQLLLAIPIGIASGVVGGCFNRSLVWCTAKFTPLVQKRPVKSGLLLGGGLSVLALLSWGSSTGDGEALLQQLLQEGMPNPFQNAGPFNELLMSAWITLVRLVGPILALAPGVPGGLIDPSLTFGGVLGFSICSLLGASTHLGIGLGMAAGLAGVTQLPLVSIVFAWRLVGDQQLFTGVVLCAVLAAYVGRLVSRQPVYHALANIHRERR